MSDIEKEIESRIYRRALIVFIAMVMGVALPATSAILTISNAHDEAVNEIRQERMDAIQAIERARPPHETNPNPANDAIAKTIYWVTTSSGKVHNSSCRHFHNSNGYETTSPSGDNCKICGGTFNAEPLSMATPDQMPSPLYKPIPNSVKSSTVVVGTVVGITDGDTVIVLDGDKTQIKVRLHGIDAPESGQAFGNKSRQHLADLIFQKEVSLQITDTDKYARKVARIYLGDRDINLSMLQDGYAWHYKKYDQSPNYAAAENEARNNKSGLWADGTPMAPWVYRHPTNKATTENVNGIAKSNGMFAEDYFYNALETKQIFAGIHFDKVLRNQHAIRRLPDGNRLESEFDLQLTNRKAVALISLKYRVRKSNVKDMVERQVVNFRQLFPEYDDYKIYLGLGGMSFGKDVIDEAKKLGIGLLQQKGEIVEYVNDEVKPY